ncbi:MAG TPA: hypothetical protein VD996_00780 [Chitinophagaceae bacterium]|nr:hypothetical protein [Chitinophagaceae bacterium]
MKKTFSIVLLLVFFLFHTGRILLYFECKLSNSITTSSCDCNQLLTGDSAATAAATIPINSHANHKHLPEEFELCIIIPAYKAAPAKTTAHNLYVDIRLSGFTPDIFRPPLHS